MNKDLKEKFIEKINCIDLDKAQNIFSTFDANYSPVMLFNHFFDCIPNIDRALNIACSEVSVWIKENLSDDIITQYFKRKTNKKDNGFIHTDLFIPLNFGILIHLKFLYDEVEIYYREDKINVVKNLWRSICSFQKVQNSKDAIISLVYFDNGDLNTRPFQLKPSNVDLNLHYNDDFIEVHQVILDRLNIENDWGLILLHGLPGTGKTNYLRYLFSQTSKKVIFLPENLATKLSNAEMITFLLMNKNSILVIEDAENLVINRETGSSTIASLLNIADGLLSDCLSIQFVCTFNTDLSNIDKALLRKGRLIAKYYFGQLNQYKAQILSDSLGYNLIIKKDTSLADIFYQDKTIGSAPEISNNKLGFAI
ncbi:hypothetical protein CHU00_12410, partial [Sphingobacterium cellulitidis]|uniref:AAA family ATPase n=1 Tax=Sphingobacterium cellulitidis TaxID=1768011 RepID=UPI000B944B29